ncbi:MAG: Signal transduction histidine-protein kinase/phosphatase DegS [Ferruginibacter sp.]|nr:Signal transduction histidine-protein kinase/phosphatase DegS [Ferruginibacter sp.]
MDQQSPVLQILIVEDNAGDMALIQDYLRDEFPNIQIVPARNYTQALAALKTLQSPDLILLDLSLPDNSGEDLVNGIISNCGECPVIVLTGMRDKQFGMKTLSMGISDYLLKDELTASQLHKSILYSIERNRIYNELKYSEQKYRSLFELSPTPMWVFDVETLRFLSVNEAAIRHYGYSEEEFLQATLADIRPKEDLGILEDATKEMKSNAEFQKAFARHLKKDNSIIFVDIHSNQIEFAGRKARLVLATDVTAKVKAERDLKLMESVIINTTDTVMITEARPYGKEDLGIVYVNDAFTNMTGYTREEVLRKTPRILQGLKTDPIELERMQKAIAALQPFETEVINYKKNGDEYWVNIAIAPVTDEKGVCTHWIAIEKDVTDRKKEDQRVTKAIINAQEEERTQVGYELHDNVNQILVGSILALGMTKQSPSETTAWVAKARGYISDAINEIRKLSHQLAPASFEEQSLQDVMVNLVNKMNVNDQLLPVLNLDALQQEFISDDIQLNLYRILQEQLNNIVKYSKATQLELSVYQSPSEVSMRIFDNGVGFDPSVTKGIGLNNIRRRIESFAGTFKLHTSPGAGCEIIATIPLNGQKTS